MCKINSLRKVISTGQPRTAGVQNAGRNEGQPCESRGLKRRPTPNRRLQRLGRRLAVPKMMMTTLVFFALASAVSASKERIRELNGFLEPVKQRMLVLGAEGKTLSEEFRGLLRRALSLKKEIARLGSWPSERSFEILREAMGESSPTPSEATGSRLPTNPIAVAPAIQPIRRLEGELPAPGQTAKEAFGERPGKYDEEENVDTQEQAVSAATANTTVASTQTIPGAPDVSKASVRWKAMRFANEIVNASTVPSGWEVKSAGPVVFYCATAWGLSTRTKPTAAVESLPKGWCEHTTGEGKKYYANMHNQKTQWLKPTAEAPKSRRRLLNRPVRPVMQRLHAGNHA